MHRHAGVCVLIYIVCMCRGQGSMLGIFPNCSPLYLLRQGLSLNWDSLIWLDQLAIKPQRSFVATSQCQDHRCTSLYLAFLRVLGNKFMSLCWPIKLCWQPFLQPLCSYWVFMDQLSVSFFFSLKLLQTPKETILRSNMTNLVSLIPSFLFLSFQIILKNRASCNPVSHWP